MRVTFGKPRCQHGSTAAIAARFAADRTGATAVEYGVLAMMIGIFLVSIANLGEVVLVELYEKIVAGMENNPAP